MSAASKGSITVGAMFATGVVTLGVALTGLAGMGDDLRAASAPAPAPRGPVYDDSTESATQPAWRESVRQPGAARTGPRATHTFCTPEEAAERALQRQRQRKAAAARQAQSDAAQAADSTKPTAPARSLGSDI